MRIHIPSLEVRDQKRMPQGPQIVQPNHHPRFLGALPCERRPRRKAKSVAPSRVGTNMPERTATPVQKEVAMVALSSRAGLGVSDHLPVARSRAVARAPESSQPA